MKEYKKLTNALRLYAKCYRVDAFADCSCKNELVADLFEQSADAIEELTKSKWISVKDRLPENETQVLAVCVYPKFTLVDTRIFWKNGEWMWAKDCEITHWMPLPDPPKGEEE